MKGALIRKRVVWTTILAGVLVSGFLIFGSNSIAMQEGKSSKKMMHEKAYSLYQSKCLGCHISVADPERPAEPVMTGTWWFKSCIITGSI
jgi:hypothetical protein